MIWPVAQPPCSKLINPQGVYTITPNINSQVKLDQYTSFYLFAIIPSQDTVLLLTGSSRGYSTQAAIISPDWDFSQMGIGGLDKVQFSRLL